MYEQNMRIIDRHLGSLSRASHPQHTTSSATNGATNGVTSAAGTNLNASPVSREQLARDKLMQSNVQVPFERHLWNEPPLTRHVRQLYKFHSSTEPDSFAVAGSETDEWIDVPDGAQWASMTEQGAGTQGVSERGVEDDIVALDDAYLGDLGLVEDPSYLYYA